MAWDKGDCNLALLSILKQDGKFTWAVDNFRRIALTESPQYGRPQPQSIFGECVCITSQLRAFGGFRQVRESGCYPSALRKTANKSHVQP